VGKVIFGTLIPSIYKRVNWLKEVPFQDLRLKGTDPLTKEVWIMCVEAVKKSDQNKFFGHFLSKKLRMCLLIHNSKLKINTLIHYRLNII